MNALVDILVAVHIVENEFATFLGKDHSGPRARAYLRRFNNRMIPLMEERREFIFNNVYGNKNIDQGIHGCSGQELYSLRAASEQEMLSLRGFIDAMKLEIAGTH